MLADRTSLCGDPRDNSCHDVFPHKRTRIEESFDLLLYHLYITKSEKSMGGYSCFQNNVRAV